MREVNIICQKLEDSLERELGLLTARLEVIIPEPQSQDPEDEDQN